MKSRFLTAIWVTAAAIIVVMVPASQLMQGAQREWAQAAIAASIFLGLTATLIFNRTKRGLWLPGKDGRGAEPRGWWITAFILIISAYFSLRPLHVLPW
jgi:hypothetical protein